MTGFWPLGTVAMVAAKGAEERLALRTQKREGDTPNMGWEFSCVDSGGQLWMSDQIGGLSVRPLVVIDPEDRGQADRLRYLFMDVHNSGDEGDDMQSALRDFATPKPPQPAEPTGLYAAVEDVHGNQYVRLGNGPRPWMHNGSPSNSWTHPWADLDVAEVLTEGVTQ